MSTNVKLASGLEVLKDASGAVDGTDLAAILSGDRTLDGAVNYALAATSDNIAYTLAVPHTALNNGDSVTFKMPAANSGASATLNVNSLGAKKMLRSSDMATQITTGDLLANGTYMAVYNATLDGATGAWVVYNTPSTATYATTNTAQTITAAKQFATTFNFAETAGTAPTYTLAVPITALVDGAFVAFKCHSSATNDDATLNVNSLGAKPLAKQSDKSQITDADVLRATVVYTAYYSDDCIADGAWVVQGI